MKHTRRITTAGALTDSKEVRLMDFVKNENGCVKFTDTAGISHDIWELLLRRINHLGYALPDTDFLKEYFDRHVFLQPDQSREVLIVFGQMHEEKLYSPKQIKRDNQKAKEYFGTTTVPSLAGYLLTDGDMLLFSYEGYKRDMDHREISNVISTDDDDSTQAMYQFINYGNIRLQHNGFSLSRRPTRDQKQILYQMIYRQPELYVDITNTKGHVVKHMEYEYAFPGFVLGDIEAYFTSLCIDKKGDI